MTVEFDTARRVLQVEATALHRLANELPADFPAVVKHILSIRAHINNTALKKAT